MLSDCRLCVFVVSNHTDKGEYTRMKTEVKNHSERPGVIRTPGLFLKPNTRLTDYLCEEIFAKTARYPPAP